jgi:EAL domain-containing protein (putative c-di-GMP-specific phosphodiesterase class I)/putative methionine-R-sulfoxide reductase with GAF domain
MRALRRPNSITIRNLESVERGRNHNATTAQPRYHVGKRQSKSAPEWATRIQQKATMAIRAQVDHAGWDRAASRVESPVPAGGDSLTRLVEELLQPGAIEMAAQPIVRVADGSILGFEMLMRSSIPCSSGPDQWLEHASYLGVRTELELACLQAAVERGAPPGDVRLFVNLSARTLLDPRVDDILNALPPRVLEITEHEPVSDYQELRRRLQMWSAASTMLAIDDVGAGYSSMSHVLQLHPQFIKIDRSLVHKAHRDPNKLAVLRGLVGFARQGGITSLAEGVETSEELNALRAIGIDLVQGYLLARPGDGWPQPRRWRSAGTRRTTGGDAAATGVGSLADRVEKTLDPGDAADEVTAYLSENFAFLPSVYVERAGILRFLSGRGQWQILDGIEAGVGLTGSAFAAGEAILVQDVSADSRYREAVPSIVAEFAVPLIVQRRVVGVLNVDAPAPIDHQQADAVRAAVTVLEAAFERTGLSSSRGSPLVDFGWHAPRIAESLSLEELAATTTTASVAVARLQSAVLWTRVKGRLVQQGSTGARAEEIASLTASELEQLAGLVSHVASSYSAGPVISRTFGPMGLLRDQGFGTVFVAAIRDRGVPSGLLVLAGPDAGVIEPEAVQALELLCVLTGVTLARIGPV